MKIVLRTAISRKRQVFSGLFKRQMSPQISKDSQDFAWLGNRFDGLSRLSGQLPLRPMSAEEFSTM